MGAFMENERPKETVSPEYFFTRFDDKWAAV